jgi:AraC family transcriptional regulator of adaptative response / DNA-3-methyladenine glycosylase II
MDALPRPYYDALRSRDARFDGKFFVGVVTTGIYCRPICPAPPAKRSNLRWFPCAAAAESAGFRPCRRCRPETAPGTPAWVGTSATVSRALALISDGALDKGDVDDLAARVGVGSRHLRRLFDRHLGANPVAVAQCRRVQFARSLIDQTALPLRDVALAAGFASIRRFNAAIRSTFERTPSELRRAARRDAVTGAPGVTLRLPYRPPYAWDEVLEYLTARAVPGVEQVVDGTWRRTALIDGAPALVEVRPDPAKHQVVVRVGAPVRRDLLRVVERVRRVFDLGADPLQISSHLRRDPRLRAAVSRRPGLRVPGAWDPFELAVRAVLGQQVSVKGATTLAGRLAAKWGERVEASDASGPHLLFPAPERLARAKVEGIGIPGARAAALRGLARRCASGELRLDRGVPFEEALAALLEIPGIGPWTAQYIALRALGEPDVFLPGDLGVRRALASNGRLPSAREAEELAEPWRPWRGYAVLHLWLGGAGGAGGEET